MAAAPATVDEFLSLMRKSGLVEEARLKVCLDKLNGRCPAAPAELAERLQKEGLLTAFHTKQLLAGRYKGFFLGQYRVLEPLGAGGMGVVYLCEHAVMKRRVAVKILPSDQVTDPATRERFMREARAAAALDHPNIVRAFTIEEHGKLHFLVMEYIDGQSLHQLVKKEGPLDPVRAAGYARQTALGLEHIGDKGLVHRDIKPANLLLDKKGVVKILDMGLARFSHGPGDNLTRRLDGNAVLGTADYIAPEQAMDSHEADIRADIYSLGATLYFLLTGQPPFAEGTSTQKLLRIQMCSAKPIREVRDEIPEALAKVIERMMARDPAERYQSPTEVVAALNPFCADAPARSLTRRPCEAGALARSSTRQPREAAPPKTTPSWQGNFRPAASSVRRPRAAASAVRPSRLLAERGQPDSAERRPLHLDCPIRRTWPVWVLYGVGAAVVVGLCIPAVLICVLMSGPDTGKAAEDRREGPVAPGNPAAFTSTVVDPAPVPQPREVRSFVGHTGAVERLAVSPDGRQMLSTSADCTVRLWDLETGLPLHQLHGHSKATHGIAFNEGGRLALSGSADSTIRLWDLQTAKERKHFKGHKGQVWCVCFGPDGQSIASAGADKTVRLWDLATGKETRRFAGHTAAVMSLAFSPDGKQMITCSHDRTLRLWDVETGQEVRTFEGHTGPVITVVFVADGQRVLSCSHDKTLRLWSVGDGKTLRVFEGHSDTIVGLALSPEGKRILSGGKDGDLRLWDLDSGAALGTIGRHSGKVTCVAFTPDGSRALTGSDDRTLRLWRLPAANLGTTAGLVGHWKFDEGKGDRASDSSGKGHHGQLVNQPTWTMGKLGGGLSLNGRGDHVRTSFTRQLDVWTISLWVKGEQAPRNIGASGPLHREQNFQISWDHSQRANRGAAVLRVKGIWYSAQFGPLNGRQWYHLAATFDGEKLRAYKDGVLVATTAAPGVPGDERAPLTFGKHAVTASYFAGVVDDARVYDRPLGNQDIAALFAVR
jgi:serine/threonine protein kinase